MGESLIIADAIELIGTVAGPAVSAIPSCAGATFQLQPGFDMSAPQPTTAVVASLLLDGERPFGYRASNRTLTLPVEIVGTDFNNLAAAREVLLNLIDQQTWTLRWTRDPGSGTALPLLFDCFRAHASSWMWGNIDGLDQFPIGTLTISFDALPYGRSDLPVVTDFTPALAGRTPALNPVSVDTFATVNPGSYSGNFLSAAAAGFETGIGTWVAGSNCSVAQTTAQAHSGTHSLQLSSTAAGLMNAVSILAANVTSSLPVIPGQQVSCSMWFRTAVSARSCTAQVQFYTNAGTTVSTVNGTTVTDSTSAWTQSTAQATTPAGAAFCRAVAQVAATGAGSEVHYIDDVVLDAGQWTQSMIGPGPFSAHWNPAAPPGNQPTGQGLAASYSAVLGTGASLISAQDSDFESALSGNWTATNGTLAQSSLEAFTGTHSLQATTTSGGTPVVLKISDFATAGLAYSYSAQVLAVTPGRTGQIILSYFTAGLAHISDSTPQIAVPLTAGSWTQVQASEVAPATAAFVGLQVSVSGLSTGEVFFTDTVQHFQAVGLENMAALTFFAGFGSGLFQFFQNWARTGGPVVFSVTLTDASSNVLSFSKTHKVKGTNTPAAPKFTKVRVPIPQTTAAALAFNFSAVCSYTIKASNRATGELRYTDLYLDSVQGAPVAIPVGTPSRGIVYDLTGITGSARSGVSLQVQQDGAAVNTTDILTNPGNGQWLAPPGVTSVKVEATGAGGGGGPATNTASGGGGGGEYAAEAAVAVTPGVIYQFAVGIGGNQTTGQPATASSFTGDTVTVNAHAGTKSSGTSGGAGGTGSTNTTHNDGGAGSNGATNSGAGGGSAGSGSTGGAASGTTGGTAGSGTTPGAAGGAGRTAQNNGRPGGAPGGGGGGAKSTSVLVPQMGGNGGNGQLKLTYLAPPSFKTLIAHRPPPDAPETLTPFVSPDPGDTPDGTTQYPVQSLITGLNARFAGTYTVVLVNNSWASPSASRNLSVTVTQWEQAGGNSYPLTVGPLAVIPNNLDSAMVVLGVLTLPLKAFPPDNLDGFFTVSITSSNTSDSFLDVLFLDTMGETVIIQSPNSYLNMYLDEPNGDQDIGLVLGTVVDRSDAISILDWASVSGPGLTVAPNGNQSLLLYCVEGAPSAELSYFPRYFFDRPT